MRQDCRNKGIAKKLMKNLIVELDKNGWDCLCEINPYGDLDYEQLLKFYKSFGFVDYKTEFGDKILFRQTKKV